MNNRGFYIPVLSFLVLAAVTLLAVHSKEIGPALGNYACKADDCSIQRWMEAIATVGGLCAAVLAGWFAFGQLAELRKQTAFMLGDGEPEFEVVHAATATSNASFAVVNVNRRTTIIGSVVMRCRGDGAQPRLTHIVGEDRKFHELRDNGRPFYRPSALGHKDRQGPPNEYIFTLVFDKATHDYVKLDPTAEVEIAVKLEFPGTDFPPCERSVVIVRAAAFASNIRPTDVHK